MRLINKRATTTTPPTTSSRGKRKKEQLLLLKPPPPTSLDSQRRSNDDDYYYHHHHNHYHDDDDRMEATAATAAARSTTGKQVENDEQRNSRLGATSAADDKREAPPSTMAMTDEEIHRPQKRPQSSSENLNSRQCRESKFNKPKMAATSRLLASESSEDHHHHHANNNHNNNNNNHYNNHFESRRRTKFEDLRHYFDFNRMRLRHRPSSVISDAALAGSEPDLMMAASKNHQRQTSAARMTRRKSELTSFLTILFGTMLAVLLLASCCNLILCSGGGGGGHNSASPNGLPLAGARTMNASAQLNAMTAPAVSTTNLTAGSRPPAVKSTAPAETEEVTLAPPANSGPDADGAPTGGGDSSRTPTTDKDYDEGSSGDGNHNDDDQDLASPNKVKLADLLADTARDTTDLLVDHLQRGANADSGRPTEAANSGDSDEEPEEGDEDNQLSPKVSSTIKLGTGSQLGGNLTSASTGGEAVASPLAAMGVPPTTSGERAERQPPVVDEQLRYALETYAKWRAAGDDIIELFSRKLMPIIIEHGYDVDSGTVGGLLQAFNGVRQLRPWAIKLLDAWTKISPGILLGTQSDFGDFDECLGVRVDDPNGLAAANSEHFPSDELDPLTGLKTTTLVGRYCLADVEFPKPPRRVAPADLASSNTSASPTWPFEPIELRQPLLDFAQLPAYKDTIFVETGNFFHMLYVDPIRVGICLTNKIDPQSFQQVFNKLLEEFRVTINFRGRCVTKYDQPTWTSSQRVSASVLLVACALVALSTLLDLFQMKLNKMPWPHCLNATRLQLQLFAIRNCDLITSFSLIRNTRRLFKASKGDGGASKTAPSRTSPQATLQRRAQAIALSACNGGEPSIADSSVESSPSIERRSSADTTTSSTKDLISIHHQQDSTIDRHQRRHFATQMKSAGGQHGACLHDAQSRAMTSPARAAAAATTDEEARVNLMGLHGIRVITMVWMIVNHTYMFGGFFVLWAHRRLIDIAEWPKSLSFQFVLNGWLTVETYFFLSAMIIVLNVMPLLRAHKFNYFLYITHRLLRLLPAYVGLVALNFLWPLVSSGPVWLVKGKSFVQDPCENYLWTNFLFINNWIWPEKQCMVHTWFLSADFQLYLLAPAIVYLFYRRPALGHWLNLIVAVLAAILSGFVIYANKLLPTTLINKLEFDAIKQQLSYSYFATYQHMGPYCLGLLVGYLLHKRPRAHLPKHLTWLLWLTLPPLSFTTLLLTYLWNGAYPEANLINPSPLVSALYVAIHRTIWSALVAWLVFACATGRARLLSSFLSSSIFLPVSRLSYSIYLVHLPVIMFRALNLRHTVEWTDQNILWEACGNFVVSLILGFFLNVAFESPIINLESVLFKRGRAETGSAISLTSTSSSSSSSSSSNSKDISKSVMSDSIFKRTHLVMGGHSEKPTSGGGVGGASPIQRSSYPLSSSSSSEACEDSLTHVETRNTPTGDASERPQTTRTPRPKLSASVRNVAGRPYQPQRGQPVDLERRFMSTRWAHQPNTLTHEHQQHQHHEADQTEADTEESKTSASFSTGSGQSVVRPLMNALGGGHQRRASQGIRSMTLSHRRSEDFNDELYSVAAEYRHYAPGGYQQWRRAMNMHHNNNNNNSNSNAHLYQPPANSSSMRLMQYATLARTARPLRPQQEHSETVAQVGRSNRLEQEETRYHQQQQQQQYSPYDDRPHHDPLFPNSSELNFEHSIGDARSTLIQQRELLASRRRQGRYNTLTGTGSRDWRSQLQARQPHHHHHHHLPQDQIDPLREWNQQRPLASELGVGGGLMIPRIDWSSTLRRQARNATGGAPSAITPAASMGATTGASASGSTLGRQQDQPISDGKIDEELAGEADETSVL